MKIPCTSDLSLPLMHNSCEVIQLQHFISLGLYCGRKPRLYFFHMLSWLQLCVSELTT